jgi:glycosyltransferase involved in cell wall biosynthesis
VPVVASRVGGLPEVIEDGVSGVLHPPAAHDAMAESSIALLTNHERQLQVGQAARQRVLERYCAERIIPMYEACYEAVLQ